MTVIQSDRPESVGIRGDAEAALTITVTPDHAPRFLSTIWVVRFRLLPDLRWRARYYSTREGAYQCARYEAARLRDVVVVDQLEIADVIRDEVRP